MNRKERIEKLKKIAQQAAATTTTAPAPNSAGTPAQTAAPATPNSPKASILLPTLNTGWGSNIVPFIDDTIQSFDAATISLTNGKYNFKSLWDTRFPSGTDDQYVTPTKDFLKLFRKVYISFLNSGNAFSKLLAPADMTNKINSILDAQEFKLMLQQGTTFPLRADQVRQKLMSMSSNIMVL